MDTQRTWAVAAAIFVAGLVFPLSGTAIAWQGDLQADPLHGIRQGAGVIGRPVRSVEIPAEGADRCGKCHSACEEGKIHEGRSAAALPPDVELPLTADGRTTCFTCHAPHRSGQTADGAQLRMSNLRRELCLVCHRQQDDGIRIRIVSPPDRAVVQEARLALIGNASGDAEDLLAVRLNGTQFQLPVKTGEFSTWLSLQEGVNRIEIVQRERVLWKGEVFRGDGDSSGYGRKTSAHRTDSREQCQGCHDGRGGMILGDGGDMAKLCYRCHDRFDEKRFIHGPLAIGACLVCHDPHRGYGTAHLREEQAILCESCHSAREIAGTPVCHTTDKACADCHDPHQSDSRYLLKGLKHTMRDGLPPRQ